MKIKYKITKINHILIKIKICNKDPNFSMFLNLNSNIIFIFINDKYLFLKYKNI